MKIAGRSACLSTLIWVTAVGLWLSPPAEAQQYKRTDLVSDLAGATFQDAHLVNPWGLSRSSGSPWWAADNGTGFSTLYDGVGNAQPLVVTIPPAAGGTTGVPTGTVFNGTTDFKLPNGNPARFLFVAEDGTISGWNGGTQAVIVSTYPDAVYKGAAIASRNGVSYLYVANFGQKRIDVFDSTFQRVRSGHGEHDSSRESLDAQHGDSKDAFRDERLPRSFSPFNVQNIGGSLYVAFAKLGDDADEVPGAGLGYVDVFSPSGRLLRRLEHGPWGGAPGGGGGPATSGRSATTCSWASSAAVRSRSTTCRRAASSARCRTLPAPCSRSRGSGRSASGTARTRGRSTRCTSPRGSRTRHTASSVA
jgi:uncharacterized protein (TIGR03118 family)